MQKILLSSSSIAAALISAVLLFVNGTFDALAAKKSIRIRANIGGGVTEVTAPATKASSQNTRPTTSGSVIRSRMNNHRK